MREREETYSESKKIKTPIKPKEYFAQISGKFITGIWLKTTNKTAIDLNILKLFKLLFL